MSEYRYLSLATFHWMKYLALILISPLLAACISRSAPPQVVNPLSGSIAAVNTPKPQHQPDTTTKMLPRDSLKLSGGKYGNNNYQVKIYSVWPGRPADKTGDFYNKLYILKNGTAVDSVALLSDGAQNFGGNVIKENNDGFTFDVSFGSTLTWNIQVYCRFIGGSFSVYRVEKSSIAPDPSPNYSGKYPVKPLTPLHQFDLIKYMNADTHKI